MCRQSDGTALTEALVKAVPVEHCWLHPTEVSTTQFIISCRPSSILKDLDAYTAEEEQDKKNKGRKRKTEPQKHQRGHKQNSGNSSAWRMQ